MAKTAAKTYRVKSGDNWFNVAEKMTTPATNLVKANPTVKKIVPGQVLRAPQPASQPNWGQYYAQGGVPRVNAPPSQFGAKNDPEMLANIRAIQQDFRTLAPGRVPNVPSATGAAPAVPVPGQRRGTARTPQPRAPATTTPAQPSRPMSRAQAREGQNTLANTYSNMSYVQIAMNSGKLPLVVRPSTAQALGIDENYLAQLGYTQDNDYGYWIRPMYAQEQPGQAPLAGGGGYGSYGDGYSASAPSAYPPDVNYGVEPGGAASGYARNQRGIAGSMPLVTWRI